MESLSTFEYRPQIAYHDMHEYIEDTFYRNYDRSRCVSPSEEAFIAGFCHAFGLFGDLKHLFGPYVIKPHVLVGTREERYCVGISISECLPVYEDTKTDTDCEGHVVVECGGIVDMERDRRILELVGAPTIHFSEEDIFKDPIKCAVDAVNILHAITENKRECFRNGYDFARANHNSDE